MEQKIVVSGMTGFIAGHVVKLLLEKGYSVVGSARSDESANNFVSHLTQAGVPTKGLSWHLADLESDHGWAELCDGAQGLMHIASPFPLSQPKDRKGLVPQAVEGTLRVLEAARKAGVTHFVVTSSIVAMMYQDHLRRIGPVTIEPDMWTDLESPKLSAYIVSKTRAEQALWDWAKEHDLTQGVTTVNPGFVLGPSIGDRINTSQSVVRLMLNGSYPALPKVHYATIDVRDLAAIHVAALENPSLGGQRVLAAGKTLSMVDMARVLKATYPENNKIPTGTLPDWFIRLLSTFDNSIRSVLPDLGLIPQVDWENLEGQTGVSLRPIDKTIEDTAEFIRQHNLV